MKTQCDECAFKKGAEANAEPYNNLRGRVCALGAVPFFCHHGLDWKNQRFWVGPILKEKCRQSGVCEGWRAEVQRLHAKGWFGEYRTIRQAIAKQCLQAIELFIGEENETEKRKLGKLLRRMVRFLSSKDIAHKKLPLLWG